MKKILINLPILGPAGINLVWLFKFKKFQSLGCQLFVFGGSFIHSLNLENENLYFFNQRFTHLKASPTNKIKFILYSLVKNFWALFFIKKIIKNNYDIVYSPAASLDLILLPFIIKKLNKRSKWLAIFDNIVPLKDPGNKIIRILAWLFFQISLIFLKKADKIFVTTPESIQYLSKKTFGRDKIILAGYAVEGQLIKTAKANSVHAFDALFVGRINETKGIYDMLKVLTLVKQKYPNFRLAIMGQGDETTEEQFKNKIKEMGLENNIQFLGYITGQKKFNIIKSAKVFWFLSVSQSESFGVALLEAVCSGRLAIAYDLEQFKRIYQNDEVFIFPKGDYQSVAKKTIEIFDQQKFGNERGQLLLEKYGNWDKIAEIEYNTIIKM